MNIDNYKVEKIIVEANPVSMYIVSDKQGELWVMRMLNRNNITNESVESWFEYYEEYRMKVANYKYLPKAILVSTYKNTAYTLFPYHDGSLLRNSQYLELNQIDNLLDAVSHLHKKGFVHGNICEDNIWIRDDGRLILFGALEQFVICPMQKKNKTIQTDIKQILHLIKKYTNLNIHCQETQIFPCLSKIQKTLSQ